MTWLLNVKGKGSPKAHPLGQLSHGPVQVMLCVPAPRASGKQLPPGLHTWHCEPGRVLAAVLGPAFWKIALVEASPGATSVYCAAAMAAPARRARRKRGVRRAAILPGGADDLRELGWKDAFSHYLQLELEK